MGKYDQGYGDGYSQAQFEQNIQGLPHDGITGFKAIPIGCGYLFLMVNGLAWVVYPLYLLFTSHGIAQFFKTLPSTIMITAFGIAFMWGIHTLFWNYRRKMMRLYGTSERSERERERYAREQAKKTRSE